MGRHGRAAWLAALVGVVTFAVVFVGILVLRHPADPPVPGYTEATRASFVDACVQGDTGRRPICTCVYDKIEARVPFARYLELNTQTEVRVATGADPVGTPATTGAARTAGSTAPAKAPPLPDDLEVIVVGCIARESFTVSTSGAPGSPSGGTSVLAPPGSGPTLTLAGEPG